MINVLLMGLSVFLQRRVFLIFGALGVFGYFGYLAFRLFRDSLVFPFALSLLGIFVIFLGIKYQKNRKKIEKVILSSIPDSLNRLLPRHRRQQT